MEWLKANTPHNSIILSSFHNGNVIPLYSDRIVYAGHGPMTIFLNDKMEKVENFYSTKNKTSEIFNFLRQERINYVFFSEDEKN